MTMLERNMQNELFNVAAALSDVELIERLKSLASNERHATVQLVAHLAEMDARRLYLGEGCSSLFTYCTQVLHLSEHAAYGRIEAARAARKFPMLLEAVASGALHLTAVTLIAPHLTVENVNSVIAAARHKTKRDVEELAGAPFSPVPAHVARLRHRRARPNRARSGHAVVVRPRDPHRSGEAPGPRWRLSQRTLNCRCGGSAGPPARAASNRQVGIDRMADSADEGPTRDAGTALSR